MQSMLPHAVCTVCGRRHTFCHSHGTLRPGQDYSYMCPEKGSAGVLRVNSSGRPVNHPPQGAVSLTERRPA
jgi:hypothetical protein